MQSSGNIHKYINGLEHVEGRAREMAGPWADGRQGMQVRPVPADDEIPALLVLGTPGPSSRPQDPLQAIGLQRAILERPDGAFGRDRAPDGICHVPGSPVAVATRPSSRMAGCVAPGRATRSVLFVHPSDEAYGADRVLLRIANLGYEHHAMTLDGIPMTVVAKDASPLVDQLHNLSYETNTVEVGPGESRDVIFKAPAKKNNSLDHDVYRLYDRNYAYLSNGGAAGYGGQMTEVHVYPSGHFGPQTKPNE